jgi:methylenetetrahydrofolate reductase (NADPH)
MPIQNFSTFIRMTDYCGIKVPTSIMDLLSPVKEDDDAVKEIGCRIAIDICKSIVEADLPGVEGFHFYTLNLERSVTRILDSMKSVGEPVELQGPLISSSSESAAGAPTEKVVLMPCRKTLPWRPSTMDRRAKEEIRPINWANRPKSYVARTDDWDEYPNGRWGDSTSPAFGELSDVAHYYTYSFGSEDDRREMLAKRSSQEYHSHLPPSQPSDIFEVFARYIEGKIPYLPWCESSLQPESFTIQKELAELNRRGFLTINSQPAVNGVPSDHPQFGWGGSNGYVYQKAYCECFVSPEIAEQLVFMVSQNPSMNLYAVNCSGKELKAGVNEGGVTALTWGKLIMSLFIVIFFLHVPIL